MMGRYKKVLTGGGIKNGEKSADVIYGGPLILCATLVLLLYHKLYCSVSDE